MPKVIPIAVQAELDKSAARLATCLRVERRDSTVFCFTTNRVALTIDGEAYLPTSSFVPSDVATGSNLDADDLEITGALSSIITEDDVRVGRWDFAAFRVFQVNYASPSDGQVKLRAGHLGKITVDSLTFGVELLGRMEAYGTSIGEITQPGCRTSLGTTACGITPVTVSGAITFCGTDLQTLKDNTRTEDDGYFDEGIITFTSGDADGLSYEIKAYIYHGGDPIFVTKLPVGYDVTGATYTMSQGCARTWEACGTFSNRARYRGEPWLRGNDVLLQVGRHNA